MSKNQYGTNSPITVEMINSFLQESQVVKVDNDSNELMSKDKTMFELNQKVNTNQVVKATADTNQIMSKTYTENELNKKVNKMQILTITEDSNELMSKDKTMFELNQKVNTSQIVNSATPNNDGSNEAMSRKYSQLELNKKVDWVDDVKKMTSNDTNKILSESSVIDELNKKVNTNQIVSAPTPNNDGSNEVMSRKYAQLELNKKIDKSSGAVNGVNYYLAQAFSTTVSSGTHVFTNCWGSVTVSGSTAKVYVVNSPMLTVNGKTASNWKNIWVEGVASHPSLDIKMYIDGRMEIVEKGIGSYKTVPYELTHPFPATFYEQPTVIVSSYNTDSSSMGSYFYFGMVLSTTTNATLRVYMSSHNYENINRISYHAIGRWK